jgi:hypothetical protein
MDPAMRMIMFDTMLGLIAATCGFQMPEKQN